MHQFLLYLRLSAQTLVLISLLLSTRCLLHSESAFIRKIIPHTLGSFGLTSDKSDKPIFVRFAWSESEKESKEEWLHGLAQKGMAMAKMHDKVIGL